MNGQEFTTTDLVLNPDGSVYHLHLLNKHIADNVILVGDQDRVAQISSHFDAVEYRIKNREFVTHTGVYKGLRITAISTGIGTDNIDIVLNELYAATHINPKTRMLLNKKRKLNLVRVGTSGALQRDINVGTFVVSSFGLGLDGLIYYYNVKHDLLETQLSTAFQEQINWPHNLAKPYFESASQRLLQKIGFDLQQGITASGTGFYGPQGRNLTSQAIVNANELFKQFNYKGLKITNFDMETSALYGLGKIFGFECCTVNAIIANRPSRTYLENHQEAVENLITLVLNRLAA